MGKKCNSLLETYEDHILLVRTYAYEIQFAVDNGVSRFEIDYPTEKTLVDHFLNKLKPKFKNELIKDVKSVTTLINDNVNMAIIRLLCEKIWKQRSSLLGIPTEDDKDVKQETLSIVRDEIKDAFEVFAMKTKEYNNWNATNTNKTFSERPKMAAKPWRARTGRQRTRVSRYNRRNDKMRRAMRKCWHCGKQGHEKKQCWTLYPHLKRSFMNRIRNNKQKRSLFILDKYQDNADIEAQEELVAGINENMDQQEVFIFTHDEFDFESVDEIPVPPAPTPEPTTQTTVDKETTTEPAITTETNITGVQNYWADVFSMQQRPRM